MNPIFFRLVKKKTKKLPYSSCVNQRERYFHASMCCGFINARLKDIWINKGVDVMFHRWVESD